MEKKMKRPSGASLLEFALVLPILMLLIVGIIDLSLLLYDKAIITNASREGARYGVVVRQPTYASTSAVISYTQTYCTNHLVSFSKTPATATVTATPSTTPPVSKATLTVTVNYTYTDLVLHYFINHLPTYNLSATTVMSYE